MAPNNSYDLPDDIYCYIFSLLPVRDAVRTRSSSSRWKHLPDLRTAFQFDAATVFGIIDIRLYSWNNAHQSKFVQIVDQFLSSSWRGEKISSFSIKFSLGSEHASHIDKWIATCVKMGVKELDLDLDWCPEKYTFPCHILSLGGLRCDSLKRLCLKSCTLRTVPCSSSRSNTWLNQLTTLHLTEVMLQESGTEFVLSEGLNLRSLKLSFCCLPKTVCIQVPLLKKLVVFDCLMEIELNCPSLEMFEYNGLAKKMTFTCVPNLREAKILPLFKEGGCSSIFEDINTHAFRLQVLSLRITTEAKPVCTDFSGCHLKQLDLQIIVPVGFDFLTITHLLHGAPFLQILNLELRYNDDTKQSPPRKYCNRPLFRLKEVEIRPFRLSAIDLASYLLHNAIELEKLIFRGFYEKGVDKLDIVTSLLKKKISPNAQVIIFDCWHKP